MSNVIELQPRKATQQPFGGCQHCGSSDGYLNVGRDHWFYCEPHKTTWHIGSNLFSGWQDETEDIWRRNEYRLADHRVVVPTFHG